MTLLGGWAFAPRRTITGMLLAAGAVGRKAPLGLSSVVCRGALVAGSTGIGRVRSDRALSCRRPIFLAIDDTLARKRGLKVFGAGMHHDPLLSTRKTAIMNWGHSWVVLGVIVRFRHWPERAFCLPILFRLYLNKKSAERDRRKYRTRPSWRGDAANRLRAP